ncbi:exported hypothetical protein [uncultured delta proteobacterium]|uniref:DUF4352 domain-containing protein n=1 Tax=uncultured delta proteobacterium TaxID=34034 RepID=A0A212K922_9DELT|nr:exported hypothetical protein [uncultured delta proteobacterium]
MQNMKKTSLVSVLCLCFFLVVAQAFAASTGTDKDAATNSNSKEQSLQDIQSEVQGLMNDMVTITGSMVSGMAAGMQEGAENAQAQLDGADGTKLISNKKELAEFLQVSIFKLEEQENGVWRVTLAVRNNNDFPVRLVNLTRKQSALLLDVDGFAHEQAPQEGQSRILTVASRAAVKATFSFAGLEAKLGVFRLFDMDFPVNQ